MERKRGSTGSASAIRKGKRVAVAEKVYDSSARATRRSKRIAEKLNKHESQQLRVSFDDLPSHITAHILRRLPVKSVIICKSVCRRWKAVISDPHFAKLHLQLSPAGLMIFTRDRKLSRTMYLLECDSEKFGNDDEGQFGFRERKRNCHFKLEHKLKLRRRGGKLDLDKRDETKQRGRQMGYIPCELPLHGAKFNNYAVVNSCNGLLCLSDMERNYLVVCNPVIGEFIRLPEPTIIDKADYKLRRVDVGFGFQPKTNEYKVVRIFKGRCPLQDTKVIMGVEIHTLGTSKWRNVEFDPTHVYWLQFPTCLSGALYWICYHHQELSILCFEFESENFQLLPTPPHLFINDMTVGEYGGSLYICNSSLTGGHVKMWIMKKNDFEESWTLVFSSDIMSRPNGSLYWPVKHFQNGAALLMYHSCNCFIYYEPEKYGFRFFKVRGSKFEAVPHVPSLISLKGAVKGDNIEVMNVHSRCEEVKLQEEKEVPFLAIVKELTNLCYISSDDEE
ncbi:F-box/kelch-repeat protein At3g06240-like [Lotus japonicus]|uniref:F-box/kelch-repeat protein At3g06240-like n=1 Tax=Lotus japonicus TaxID=34305 RepID=UPI002583E8DE|nr:F-box/kelch-repeat protein At3g06240-like [Lotus japonicus]